VTKLLIRLFVKDCENYTDSNVRRRCGVLSSIVGMVCNMVLFAAKYAVGALTGSISVLSDSFNSLSDCASCVLTLFGYRLASKPADREHPFGHGRLEYLISLIIAAVITLVGFELLCSSFGKFSEPQELDTSPAAVVCLIFSIGVKLWMSAFNKTLGTKINSPVMLATSKDSRSDVIATLAALIGLISSAFTALPVDAVMGAAVSLFIMKSGIDIIRQTIDDLIGKPVSEDLTKEIERIIAENPVILGVHDLMVHCYGPGQYIGSCHAEISDDESFLAAHSAADSAEREIYSALGVHMTIHMDPVQRNNITANRCLAELSDFVSQIYEGMTIHDFRMEDDSGAPLAIFDTAVPYGCTLTDDAILSKLNDFMKMKYGGKVLVTFDRICPGEGRSFRAD